jgi:hypothetical protein
VIANGNVLVVGEKRLIGAEELADAGGVVDGGVEIGVVGNVDWLDEGRSGDGVECRFGGLSALWLRIGMKQVRDGFAKQRPGTMAKRHERVKS